jgi:hypothetical protein
MKTCALALCAFVSVLVASSLAEEDRDGNWWRTRRQFDKAVYKSAALNQLSYAGIPYTKAVFSALIKSSS